MSASPLLDLFQKNLEMSAFFGLSMCISTAGNPTVGNDNILLEFFFLGVGGVLGFGENSTKEVCLPVSKGLYSRIPFVWCTHDWRGATLLSIPFI